MQSENLANPKKDLKKIYIFNKQFFEKMIGFVYGFFGEKKMTSMG